MAGFTLAAYARTQVDATEFIGCNRLQQLVVAVVVVDVYILE